ncbi:unnamed protein product [Paramecium octaurelia]|uniref:Uncharacterized protein n=1 Tax=Paramecium octaurelia TaxID=43137 RepID=A0A8S1YLR8_PAROT|nr:unnamed protein product [Paramecium octaurelia]
MLAQGITVIGRQNELADGSKSEKILRQATTHQIKYPDSIADLQNYLPLLWVQFELLEQIKNGRHTYCAFSYQIQKFISKHPPQGLEDITQAVQSLQEPSSKLFKKNITEYLIVTVLLKFKSQNNIYHLRGYILVKNYPRTLGIKDESKENMRVYLSRTISIRRWEILYILLRNNTVSIKKQQPEAHTFTHQSLNYSRKKGIRSKISTSLQNEKVLKETSQNPLLFQPSNTLFIKISTAYEQRQVQFAGFNSLWIQFQCCSSHGKNCICNNKKTQNLNQILNILELRLQLNSQNRSKIIEDSQIYVNRTYYAQFWQPNTCIFVILSKIKYHFELLQVTKEKGASSNVLSNRSRNAITKCNKACLTRRVQVYIIKDSRGVQNQQVMQQILILKVRSQIQAKMQKINSPAMVNRNKIQGERMNNYLIIFSINTYFTGWRECDKQSLLVQLSNHMISYKNNLVLEVHKLQLQVLLNLFLLVKTFQIRGLDIKIRLQSP